MTASQAGDDTYAPAADVSASIEVAAPPPPELSLQGGAIDEGDAGTTVLTFEVDLNHAADSEVTVHYATADGTATQPDDYQATSGDLLLSPGDLSKTVTVVVNSDIDPEDDEVLTLALSDPSGASLDANHSSATGSILDDDTPPSTGREAGPRSSRRVCPVSTSARYFECLSEIRTNASGQPMMSATTPSGYGPAQFHAAYDLPTAAPTDQTIAIVDAYANPNVYADLQAYDQQFGLPAFPLCSSSQQSACLAILNQDGATSPLPAPDVAWGLEIALDVQVAHSICQNCRIDLYEADSNSLADLTTAVNTAVSMGADVVSNSYGSFLTDCSVAAYDHPNVAIVVSAGDSGYGVACPASMNSVISVGGTSLYLNGSGGYSSESVWAGTGSGCSSANGARSWQTAASNWSSIGCGSGRGMNDVAADADPATGAAVYDSYGYGWVEVGGTSLSAPLIAGVYGLAAKASSWSYPAESVYQSPANLHDVTSGSNGSCTHGLQCHAGSGYDLPTGVGTPHGLGGFGGGTPPPPNGVLSPESHDFGSRQTGTSSAAFGFTLSNTGGSQLASVGIGIVGTDASQFAISATTCGSTLGPGASCTINVVHAPSAAGTHSAMLQVTSSDPGGADTATLSGSPPHHRPTGC